MGIVRVGNCPASNCADGSCPGTVLTMCATIRLKTRGGPENVGRLEKCYKNSKVFFQMICDGVVTKIYPSLSPENTSPPPA